MTHASLTQRAEFNRSEIDAFYRCARLSRLTTQARKLADRAMFEPFTVADFTVRWVRYARLVTAWRNTTPPVPRGWDVIEAGGHWIAPTA